MAERIALLGLGLMGNGMAKNLLKGGFRLTVYNRTRERTAVAQAAGAQVANTPREAAAGAEVIISMVSDDAASRAVWLGPEGALQGVQPGAVCIDSSTVSPHWIKELAALAFRRRCALLDAPVSGSKPEAEAGELAFFVGGEPDVLERVRPVLQAMGRRVHHLGPNGSGATMKLVNNSMSAVEITVFGEALLLAERAGLNVRQVADLLSNGAPGSTMMKWRAPMMLDRAYEKRFALHLMHKDLTYALDEAALQLVPLPTVAAAREMFRLAMARGLAEADFCAVSEALRRDPKGASEG